MIDGNYGLTLVLSVTFLVFLAVLLVRQVRDTWRRHRWIPAPATIVEVGTRRDGLETIESMIRERGPWWIDYRYRTLGATRVGQARVWRRPKPTPGTVVTIYVNPQAWRKSSFPTTPRGPLWPLLLIAAVAGLTSVVREAFIGYGGMYALTTGSDVRTLAYLLLVACYVSWRFRRRRC